VVVDRNLVTGQNPASSRAAAQAVLKALGAAGCILVGDRAYYERFGFRYPAGLVYHGAPAEALMALPFDGSIPHGTVHFHEGFEATD
jgi:putative acetyltransferase